MSQAEIRELALNMLLLPLVWPFATVSCVSRMTVLVQRLFLPALVVPLWTAVLLRASRVDERTLFFVLLIGLLLGAIGGSGTVASLVMASLSRARDAAFLLLGLTLFLMVNIRTLLLPLLAIRFWCMAILPRAKVLLSMRNM